MLVDLGIEGGSSWKYDRWPAVKWLVSPILAHAVALISLEATGAGSQRSRRLPSRQDPMLSRLCGSR